MKVVSIFIIFLTMCFSVNLRSNNAGIIVACSDKYAQDLYASLRIIRELHRSTLPIQVWHSGDELSQNAIDKLSSIRDLTFHDIVDYYPKEAKEYRGYHIKGLMLYATSFEKVLLMDADVVFFQDPAVLLNHKKMLKHAAYFFRDREDFKFHDFNKSMIWYHDRYFTSSFTYEDRRNFFLHLIPEKSQFIPDDWCHYWYSEKDQLKFPIPSEHQEAGCIAMDKSRCPIGCQLIKVLNENHRLFYKYILGDKETYWLALAASKEPFYVNPTHPYRMKTHHTEREMVHFLDNELFFLQKDPIFIKGGYVYLRSTGKLSPQRSLNVFEITKLQHTYTYFRYFIDEFNKEN